MEKKTVYLVTPDTEQGCYFRDLDTAMEFIKEYVEADTQDGDPINFEISFEKMTDEEFENLPEYEG